MKKRWVKVLIGLGVLMIALWLSFLGASVSFERTVDKYKAQLRAAGEKLDLKEIIPVAVPADQNGASLFPSVASILGVQLEDALVTNPPPAMHMVAPGWAMIGWQQPNIQNEDGSNSWAETETCLGRRATAIQLFHQMSERPALVFDLDYAKGAMLLLPHVAKLKQSSQLLSAATVFELHAGDSAAAFANLHSSLALVKSWDAEPVLISQLVRIAMLQITLNAQWEFLQATNTTDEQLAALQKDWREIELLKAAENGLVGERVGGIALINQMRTLNDPASPLGISSGATGGSGDLWDDLKEMGLAAKQRTTHSLWKASWSYGDELYLIRVDQVLIEATRQIQTNGFFKDAMAEQNRLLDKISKTNQQENRVRMWIKDDLWNLLSGEYLSRFLNKLLVAETAKQLAITAIALKRFHLQHDKYPDDLAALVPTFLEAVPRDPVDGNPLRYRLNPDGSFLLYSIGEDGVDNGGDPSATSRSSNFYWQRGRDWVWPQPVVFPPGK